MHRKPTAVAAMGISQKISMIPMYISQGFSQGIMHIVSYNYAAKNRQRMKETILFSGKLVLSFMVLMTAGYWLGAEELISLFMKNETIIQYGSSFLRGMSAALPFLCIDFLAVGVFQACGFGKKSLFFAILRKIILEIPMLLILNALFPLYGLAYAQFTAEIVLATAAVIVLIRLFKDLEKQSAAANTKDTKASDI